MNKQIKIKKMAKTCKIVSQIAFYVYIAMSVILLGLTVLFEVNSAFRNAIQNVTENVFLKHFIEQLFVLALLFCLTQLFKTIESKQTPFCHNVTSWLKRLAIVVLAGATLQNFLYKTISTLFDSTIKIAFSITINTTGLIIGLAILLLSFIFEYGIDLQKQDDETL